MGNKVHSFFKEDANMSADIYHVDGAYEIRYTDQNGQVVHTESFEGKSIYYVQDAAENWVRGIKTLNG